MVAFLERPRPRNCDACGNGPCHDGTLCNNAHRFKEMVVVIDLMPARRSAEEYAKFLKAADEIDRHPRYQNHAPRSPKPGFRKGRHR